MMAAYKTIACDGEVIQWRYFADTTTSFRAIIWRHYGGTQYQIIGLNDITPTSNEVGREVTFDVPPGDRIAVKTGDVIGWSSVGGVISWTNVQANVYGIYDNVVRWSQYYPSSLDAHHVYDLYSASSGWGYREYSIQAVVQDTVD